MRGQGWGGLRERGRREGQGGDGGQQSLPCVGHPQLAHISLLAAGRCPQNPDTNLGKCLFPRCPTQRAVNVSRNLSKISRVTKTGVSLSATGNEWSLSQMWDTEGDGQGHPLARPLARPLV